MAGQRTVLDRSVNYGVVRVVCISMVDRGPGDPRELLRIWNEWEDGETTPGKVMSDLKKAGMRELLESLAEQLPAPATDAEES